MHVFVGVLMCTYVQVCKHWRADLSERRLTLLSFLLLPSPFSFLRQDLPLTQ